MLLFIFPTMECTVHELIEEVSHWLHVNEGYFRLQNLAAPIHFATFQFVDRAQKLIYLIQLHPTWFQRTFLMQLLIRQMAYGLCIAVNITTLLFCIAIWDSPNAIKVDYHPRFHPST